MTTCIAAFFVAFVIAVIMTNGTRYFALHLGVVDHPDDYRKLHARAVPRLGGIGIFFGFFIPILILYFIYQNEVSVKLLDQPLELVGILAGALFALGMGIADDVYDLRPAIKILFQVITASVAWYAGLSIEVISNPFGGPLTLGALSYPVTVFWFVGCMNAVNLMDGLDGLAAGICLFISVTLFLVSLHFLNVLGMILWACMSGAIFGFLLFNFYPAKIFLGDSGSMLLGFLIAALSLVGSTRKAETAIALLIPVVAMGLPILDTSISIVRRWYKKLPISSPDRQHIHHMLLSMGYSQRRAVLVLYSVTIMFGFAALLITIGRSEVTILVLGSLFIIAFVCIRIFGGVRIEDLFGRISQAHQQKRSSSLARMSVERAVQKMQRTMSVGGIWEICSEALRDMDLDHATLRVDTAESPGAEVMSWHNEGCANTGDRLASGDFWMATLLLRTDDGVVGRLDIGKDVSGEPPMPDVAALTEVLRQSIALNLQRLTDDDDPWRGKVHIAAETIVDREPKDKKGS